MRHHINMLREFSIPLLAGVVVAIAWANLDPTGYADFNNVDLTLGTYKLVKNLYKYYISLSH